MTAEEIKQKLKNLGITQINIANQLNKSTTAISLVINGKLKSAEIEKKLADLVGVEVDKLHAVPTPTETLTELEKLTARASRLVINMKSALDGEKKNN
jgi:transcriptional regulator with XRE-family HTH domain